MTAVACCASRSGLATHVRKSLSFSAPPPCCAPCQRNGHPAAAIPDTDVCLEHVGHELIRQAVHA